MWSSSIFYKGMGSPILNVSRGGRRFSGRESKPMVSTRHRMVARSTALQRGVVIGCEVIGNRFFSAFG